MAERAIDYDKTYGYDIGISGGWGGRGGSAGSPESLERASLIESMGGERLWEDKGRGVKQSW